MAMQSSVPEFSRPLLTVLHVKAAAVARQSKPHVAENCLLGTHEMPLYQILCIAAHYPDYQYIKQLVQQTATHVMQRGGVKKGQRNVFHKRGDYWTMHFDTSPRTLQSLNHLMQQDARVLRWTILKLGMNVEDVATKSQQDILQTGMPDFV